MPRRPTARTGLWFDRVAATAAALAVIGLAGYLLVRNEALASPQLFFALRVLLSFSVALLGASIPGFLDLGWNSTGFAVRAGGALALFVLTYVYTPDLASVVVRADGGVAAQVIRNSPISVNPAPQPAAAPAAR